MYIYIFLFFFDLEWFFSQTATLKMNLSNYQLSIAVDFCLYIILYNNSILQCLLKFENLHKIDIEINVCGRVLCSIKKIFSKIKRQKRNCREPEINKKSEKMWCWEWWWITIWRRRLFSLLFLCVYQARIYTFTCNKKWVQQRQWWRL
jgi:hypothetical protein